jgi:hypothetical protein
MIIVSEGKQIKIKTDLPVECKWDEMKKCLVFEFTKQDGSKKKYYLRKSFKDGLVLN